MKLKFGTRKEAVNALIKETTPRNIHGVKNFLPPPYPGLDESMIHFFIQRMKRQFSGEMDRDMEDINNNMDRTWPVRRSLIVKIPPSPIEEVLATYPLLCKPEHLLKEFTRVTGVDAAQTSAMKMKTYSEVTLQLASEKSNLACKLQNFISNEEDEVTKLDHMITAGLLCIPICLREKLDSFLIKSTEVDEPLYPRIVSPLLDFDEPLKLLERDIEYSVRVENKELFKTFDLPLAIICVFARYYVFHLEYPACLEGTLTFLQRAVFGVGYKLNLKQKVIQLIASCATQNAC